MVSLRLLRLLHEAQRRYCTEHKTTRRHCGGILTWTEFIKMRKWEVSYAMVMRRRCISTGVFTHAWALCRFTKLHCYNIVYLQRGGDNSCRQTGFGITVTSSCTTLEKHLTKRQSLYDVGVHLPWLLVIVGVDWKCRTGIRRARMYGETWRTNSKYWKMQDRKLPDRKMQDWKRRTKKRAGGNWKTTVAHIKKQKTRVPDAQKLQLIQLRW